MGREKRVFIVHGWGGYPEEGWFPWLKDELEKRNFKVQVPRMPNPDEPKIKDWVGYLEEVVSEADEKTYFVGHSIGCQTIMRYLEQLSKGFKVGGVVFVAGWFTLKNLANEREWQIARIWLETPINTEKVKKLTVNFVAIFSDDDPVVPVDNKEMFETRLEAKTTVEENKGHFSGDDNITELPSVLESLLSFK